MFCGVSKCLHCVWHRVNKQCILGRFKSEKIQETRCKTSVFEGELVPNINPNHLKVVLLIYFVCACVMVIDGLLVFLMYDVDLFVCVFVALALACRALACRTLGVVVCVCACFVDVLW